MNKMPAFLLKICESKLARILIPAIAGFIGYGGWGYFINSMGHGWEMGLRAGLVQGTLSFTITLVFNGVMEFIYKKLKRKYLSIAASVTALILTTYSIHTIAGTPEIIATMAPGTIIGSFYVFGYISSLAAVTKRGSVSAG